MKRETLRNLLKENLNVLFSNLEGVVTLIPKQVCDCGKPVVFVGEKSTFTCRCGRKWELIVQIGKVHPKEKEAPPKEKIENKVSAVFQSRYRMPSGPEGR